ncbi:MAG: amino acid-binding protein, partial [Deltaproteobacteria bacterium]|nr:amino acid-binding protein [Deltaproteobacteria bacterium]
YVFDIMPVIALEIDNKPGTLAKMAKKFGEEGININYVYGSALPRGKKSLFIFCPEDIDLAASIFKD